MLLTQFPHFWNFLFSNTEPIGTSNYNSLAVKMEKRLRGGGILTRGLSFLASFTWSKTMAANGLLNNSAPNPNGIGGGLVDNETFSAITPTDRTLDFAFSGLWGLPIGKGGVILKDAKGFVGHLVNDWSIDWIFIHNSGTPIGLPNGFIFNCLNHPSYLPDPGKRSFGQWLYNENPSCFTPIGNRNPYQPITVIPRVSYIRAPWRPQLTLALAKQFTLREGWRLQFKAEAFNATNTPIFGGPSTANPHLPVTRNLQIKEGDPGSCSGYGCVSANQINFPRQIQLSLKLTF
jgi:hypothetical protein